MVGTCDTPTFQVHPTRWCNLRCSHCYTSSSPETHETLETALLLRAVQDAAGLGFRKLAVSGGEPTLYADLFPLLDVAGEAGMQRVLTTNGILLRPPFVAKLRGRVEAVAVSLDGPAALHDPLRGRQGAFAAACAGARQLGDAGIPFAILFTLTQHNVWALEEMVEIASTLGASMLQVHALEQRGRAVEEMADGSPDALEAAVAVALVGQLQDAVQFPIHLDLLDLATLRNHPARFFATARPAGALGAWLHPMTLAADGLVLPVTHGTPLGFALGNLHDAPLPELAARWEEECLDAFLAASAAVHEQLVRGDEGPVFDWAHVWSRRIATVVAPRIRPTPGLFPAISRRPPPSP